MDREGRGKAPTGESQRLARYEATCLDSVPVTWRRDGQGNNDVIIPFLLSEYAVKLPMPEFTTKRHDFGTFFDTSTENSPVLADSLCLRIAGRSMFLMGSKPRST